MRPEVLVSGLAALAALAACQGDAAAPAPTPARVVEARGPDGALAISASVTEGTCTIRSFQVRREGGEVVGRSGGEVLGRVTAGGDVHVGDRRALRTARSDGRFDVIDPEGVPLARISVRDGQARIANAARQPIFTITPEADRLVVAGADGTPSLFVSGTTDLLTAALIQGPGLTSEAGYLLVCERLLDDPTAGPHDRRANQHP